MGVSYHCQVVCGIRLNEEDTKHVLSPAIYADQHTYDTKTGAIKSTKKVLAKEEQVVYKFGDLESDYLEGLSDKVAKKYGLETFYGNDYQVVGKSLIRGDKGWGSSLAEGSITLKEIDNVIASLIDILPTEYMNLIKIHAVSSVG